MANSETKPKDSTTKALKIAFGVSVALNLVLVLVGVLAANHAEFKFNQGFYEGQAQVYTWMEDWGYGKFIHRDGSGDFQFKDREKTIYIYNRNKFPDERKYPTGEPPTTRETFASH